jgi:hypothetical protein
MGAALCASGDTRPGPRGGRSVCGTRVFRAETGAVDATDVVMDQPLWQILFNIALIGFVARRAAFGLALHIDRTQPALWGVYVALCAVCALAGIAVLLSRRWVIAGLAGVLAAFTLSTGVELAVGGVAPPASLIAQLAFAIAAGGALIGLALRRGPEPQHR